MKNILWLFILTFAVVFLYRINTCNNPHKDTYIINTTVDTITHIKPVHDTVENTKYITKYIPKHYTIKETDTFNVVKTDTFLAQSDTIFKIDTTTVIEYVYVTSSTDSTKTKNIGYLAGGGIYVPYEKGVPTPYLATGIRYKKNYMLLLVVKPGIGFTYMREF